MVKLLGKLILFVSLLVWVVLIPILVMAKIEYKQNCRGYLKRAADASTIQLAERELGKALAYAEENGLTSGSTHVLYATPDTDLEFWYQNLKAAHEELKVFPEDADALTESNFLMRLRETLVDSKGGSKVTDPRNISMFPNQREATWAGLAGLVGITIGSLMLIPQESVACEKQGSASSS